jgi:hypothetical protein
MDLDAVLPNNLSHINNAVLFNHSNQWESLADQPGIDEEINYPIAASNSSQPTPINLDSSGLRCSSRTEVLNRRGLVYSDTTLMDHDERLTSPQTAHLRSASQQSFSSAHVLFSAICPFVLGSISCGKSPSIFNTDSFTPCLCIVGIQARNFNKPKQFCNDSIESHSRDASVS